MGLLPKTYTDYIRLSNQRNFVFLGPFPKNTKEKCSWMCRCGHIWNASYNSIHKGTGCPPCSKIRRGKKRRNTIEQYLAVGRDNDIDWVGKALPRSAHKKTLWQCVNGHTWEAPYYSIHNGRGCPHCLHYVNGVPTSKPQRAIAKMASSELNHKVGDKFIDVALVDEQIAIEYDGWYWHKERQGCDERRKQELLDKGWKVLTIKSSEQIPSQDALSVYLAQLDFTNGLTIQLSDWGV